MKSKNIDIVMVESLLKQLLDLAGLQDNSWETKNSQRV